MPTYEYACTQCGQHLEVFQRFGEDPPTECGACGGVLRKVFHPAGILFKGSGFYKTDSRTAAKTHAKAGADGAKSDGKADAKPATSDSKADAKPAAKEKTA